jgi:hypothetical protein
LASITFSKLVTGLITVVIVCTAKYFLFENPLGEWINYMKLGCIGLLCNLVLTVPVTLICEYYGVNLSIT